MDALRGNLSLALTAADRLSERESAAALMALMRGALQAVRELSTVREDEAHAHQRALDLVEALQGVVAQQRNALRSAGRSHSPSRTPTKGSRVGDNDRTPQELQSGTVATSTAEVEAAMAEAVDATVETSEAEVQTDSTAADIAALEERCAADAAQHAALQSEAEALRLELEREKEARQVQETLGRVLENKVTR